MIKVPILEKNAYCLIRAEKATGIILNNDNSRYTNVGNDYYIAFQNIKLLEDFIQKNKDEYPGKYEYLIYDSSGIFVKMIN